MVLKINPLLAENEMNEKINSILSLEEIPYVFRNEELKKQKLQKINDAGNDVENLRAFVYRVSRNLIIDHSRKKKAISLEELKADLPGLAIEPRPIRHYPYGSLAAHVLGYLIFCHRPASHVLRHLLNRRIKTADLRRNRICQQAPLTLSLHALFL